MAFFRMRLQYRFSSFEVFFFERGFKWAKRVYGEHMTFLIANLFGRSFHLFSTLVALLLLQMLQILSSLKKIEKTLNGRNCNWIIYRPQFWYPNYFSFALYAIESKFLLLNWKKLVWKMYFDPKLAVLFRVQKRGKSLISCDSSWSLEQQVVWCQQPLPSLCAHREKYVFYLQM